MNNKKMIELLRKKYSAQMNGKYCGSIVRIDLHDNGKTISFMAQGGSLPKYSGLKTKWQCIYIWTLISKDDGFYTSSSYINSKNELVATGDMRATKADAKLWHEHGLNASNIIKL